VVYQDPAEASSPSSPSEHWRVNLKTTINSLKRKIITREQELELDKKKIKNTLNICIFKNNSLLALYINILPPPHPMSINSTVCQKLKVI
jgi:hypothetical protein